MVNFTAIIGIGLATALLAACSAPQHGPLPAIAAATGTGQRILVVVTSHDRLGETGEKTGYWLSEVAHFDRVVRAHGYGVDFVSPKGGKPPLDERSNDTADADNAAFLADAAAVAQLNASATPTAVRADDYAAIYYAGGHGPMWDLPDNQELAALARAIYERGGVVAAVCHGPAGLLHLTLGDGTLLLAGRPVTGLSNTEEWLSGKSKAVPFSLQDELTKRGGRYEKATLPFGSFVRVSDRLITGQNPASARAVAEAVVAVLQALRAGRR